MNNDVLYINENMMDMAGGSCITFTYKSPLLTDISKQSVSHSQTINLPRTPHNEMVLGLPLHIDIGNSWFRYAKHNARVERAGITIAEGYVYLLDSTAESIAVAFIFGRNKGLEWLKGLDITLNNLAVIETMAARSWKTEADTSYNVASIRFPKYNTGATPGQMVSANVGYYGAVSLVAKIIPAISNVCGGINMSADAEALINNLFLMCATANDSDYTAKNSGTRFTPSGSGYLKAIFGSGGTVGPSMTTISAYEFTPYVSGTTTANGKYGTVVSVTVGGGTTSVYKVSATQRLKIVSYSNAQGIVFSFQVGNNFTNDDRLGQSYLIAVISNADTGAERSVSGPKLDSLERDASNDSGNYIGYKIAFKGEFYLDVEPNEEVRLQVIILPPTTATPIRNVTATGNFTFISSSLKQPIHAGESYHPAGNLPAIKPIDFLKGLATMLGFYISADGDGIKISTINEVLSNLPSAEDWSDRLVLPGEGKDAILSHYFSIADYNAQRNIIAYKEDSNDPDSEKLSANARSIILTCDNQGLEAEKTIVTLPFALSYGNNMRHYTYKATDDTPDVERKELAPRIVRLQVVDGVLTANTQGLSGMELAGSNYKALQSIIKEPHRIKVNMRLNTLQLMNINLECPIYLAQLGCYFLVEELQTTSTEICEVTLVKI